MSSYKGHKLEDLPNEDESFPLPADCTCGKLGNVKKRIMWDHGRGRGYDLVWKSGGGNNSKGGITVLLNRDGTPVISEEI